MIDILENHVHQSIPSGEDFVTREALRQKVDEAGRLRPYRGCSAVFRLDGAAKAALEELQNELYAAAPELLAERLSRDSLHMTLHDLVSGPPETEGLEAAMASAEARARPRLERWRSVKSLNMRATWLFSMVSTSLVLGLCPADGDSWWNLDGMYRTLDEVRPLGYAMTPHITLAYFRPGSYRPEQTEALRKLLRPVELELTLRTEELVLQRFSDMNHYQTIE